MAKKTSESCYQFNFKMCDDVADIIFGEQSKAVANGKFRGRNLIINRIIREWVQLKRALSEAGTDAEDTGNT
jgi:hypothetical protein